MRREFLPYNPRLKQIARVLRNNMTRAEILLWNQLKQKKLLGYDFHRQKPIDEYVVDFFCPRLSLVIEIDGNSHEGKLESDNRRQSEIERYGLSVLRFRDEEVKQNLDDVLEALRLWIEARTTLMVHRQQERCITRPLSSASRWAERGEERGV